LLRPGERARAFGVPELTTNRHVKETGVGAEHRVEIAQLCDAVCEQAVTLREPSRPSHPGPVGGLVVAHVRKISMAVRRRHVDGVPTERLRLVSLVLGQRQVRPKAQAIDDGDPQA
jgi:hypothetical protein